MALIHCTSCGHQVSDTAASCPGCGHPVATVERAPVWKQVVRFLGGLVVLGVAGVVLFFIGAFVWGLFQGSSGGTSEASSKAEPPPPVAKFVVMEHSQRDDECTELGDYCIRVHCTFYNDGNGTGEKAIGAQLLDGSDSVAVRQSTLTLLPGKNQQLYFDFKEAELDGNHHYSSRCLNAN